MKNQIKVVICGSPHSGKTVFVTSLYKMLPQKYTAIVRACPDGEGVFSNNEEQEQILLTKRKGEMSEDYIERVKNRIEKETAPIVLIDVGGLRSKENEKIMEKCDAAVILDKSQEDLEQWEKFCRNKNLEILAEIKSKRGQEEKSDISQFKPYIKANISNLERGQDKVEDITLLSLMKRITDIALQKGLERKGQEALAEEDVLDMRRVAKDLNMLKNDNIYWEEDRASEIFSYLNGFMNGRQRIKIFDARANWLVGLVSEVAKRNGIEDIKLYDARLNKYVPSKRIESKEKELPNNINDVEKYDILHNKIKLYVKENKDSAIMQFELNPKIFVEKEDIDQISLPSIDEDKKIYISGRLPLWLLMSISRSYGNTEKSVFQPGKGFIQYSSSDIDKLGNIQKEPQDINLNEFLMEVKQDIEFMQGGDSR